MDILICARASPLLLVTSQTRNRCSCWTDTSGLVSESSEVGLFLLELTELIEKRNLDWGCQMRFLELADGLEDEGGHNITLSLEPFKSIFQLIEVTTSRPSPDSR